MHVKVFKYTFTLQFNELVLFLSISFWVSPSQFQGTKMAIFNTQEGKSRVRDQLLSKP